MSDVLATLAGMLVGQRLDAHGERWVIVQPLTERNGNMLYLAVREGDSVPAAVHMIAVPKGTRFVP